MDRLISEQATIDYIVEWLYLNEFVAQDDYELPKEIEKCIKAIPSAYKGMTNGDVIKAMFPNLYSYDGEDYVLLDLSGFCGGKIEKKWWDAPYKAESEPQKGANEWKL